MNVTVNTVVSDATRDSVSFFQKTSHGIFHKDINSFMNSTFLKCSDNFEACGVTNVSQAREGVAAEIPLIDEVFWSTVKHSTPLFEFSDPVGGFFGVELSHAPVSKPFTSFHGIVEVNFPTVSWVGILQCSSTATLGHNGVSFAEKRLGDDGSFCSSAG